MQEHVRLEARRKGQRRAVAGRVCPECKRGNALSNAQEDFGDGILMTGKRCRYCPYYRCSTYWPGRGFTRESRDGQGVVTFTDDRKPEPADA